MKKLQSIQQISGNKATDTQNSSNPSQQPKRRFGISSIFDRKTKTLIDLPDDIKIYHKNEKTWMGGSDDGEIYLHIERINNGEEEIPTILAEGDLDMFICSTNKTEIQGSNIRGVDVSGTIGGNDITGYLAKVNIFKKMSYLVLAACKGTVRDSKLRSMALSLIKSISKNYGKEG